MSEELKEKLRELATRARQLQGTKGPQMRVLESDIAQLAERHGAWVREAITDILTADVSYSQHDQDMATRGGFPSELVGRGAKLPIILLGTLSETSPIELPDRAQEYVQDLVPSDYHAIEREARLQPVEKTVWRYLMMRYDPMAMYGLITVGYGRRRRMCEPPEIEAIIRRTVRKVELCPFHGWRTARLEDVHRGPHSHRPITIGLPALLTEEE